VRRGAAAAPSAAPAGRGRAGARAAPRAAGLVRARAAGRRLGLSGPRAQVLIAAALWAALAGLVYGTDPENALALAAFFLLLFGALFLTLAPLLRAVTRRLSRSRLYQEASGMHATRQALMLSAFVVLNALLQMVRAWSVLTALLLLGTFAVIEVLALTRR
jgi:hypothetical protein